MQLIKHVHNLCRSTHGRRVREVDDVTDADCDAVERLRAVFAVRLDGGGDTRRQQAVLESF